jgi:LacI family transcriptional regulator
MNNRRVTIQDIAAATGVSRAAVSLALNERDGVSDETRQRILDAATRLGYERVTRQLPNGPSIISVVVERLPVSPTSDPFNKPILQGLDAGARQYGFRLAMEFVSPEDHPDDGHWAHGGVAGVIILGGGDLKPEWVEAAAGTHLPVVMVDHFVPGLNLPAVVPDNLAGAYAATRHLLDFGHARIGFIRGPSKYWTLSERLAGYMLAMTQSGHLPDASLIPARVSHGEAKGYGEMRALLDLAQPPTAVFAVSDKTAIGAYRAIDERGMRIPHDISVIGFDDIEVGRALNPPLTTIHVPGETMGHLAIERLRRLIEGREREIPSEMRWAIATRLIERGSTDQPAVELHS